MSKNRPTYFGFLGWWELIPESCDYQQGDPPRAGTYRISEVDAGLRFDMAWTDAAGKQQEACFSGQPDGKPTPYNGGPLADALSVTAVSARELNSSAFLEGRELMVAQRQLDDTGGAMRVVQVVRLPGGESPRNVSVYRRVVEPEVV